MTDRDRTEESNEKSKKGIWVDVPPLRLDTLRILDSNLGPEWEAVAASPALDLAARNVQWREHERHREMARQGRNREPPEREDPEPEIDLDFG
jgi:hypothetical protein